MKRAPRRVSGILCTLWVMGAVTFGGETIPAPLAPRLVAIVVPDLDRAKTWYGEMLGFRRSRRRRSPRWGCGSAFFDWVSLSSSSFKTGMRYAARIYRVRRRSRDSRNWRSPLVTWTSCTAVWSRLEPPSSAARRKALAQARVATCWFEMTVATCSNSSRVRHPKL